MHSVHCMMGMESLATGEEMSVESQVERLFMVGALVSFVMPVNQQHVVWPVLCRLKILGSDQQNLNALFFIR